MKIKHIVALILGSSSLCLAQDGNAQIRKLASPEPFRVAVAYSRADSNSIKHGHENDYALAHLGWDVKWFTREETPDLLRQLDQFDLIIGTPLTANDDIYGIHGSQWRAFVENGGGIAWTDVCYPEATSWLHPMGEEFTGLASWGDCANDLNRGDARGMTPIHPINFFPNRFEEHWNSWGHIQFPEGWERVVLCGCNKHLSVMGLGRFGKGFVYLTSRRPGEMEPSPWENIRANLELHRIGLVPTAFEMTPLTAGNGRIQMSLKNSGANSVQAAVVFTVTPEDAKGKPMQVVSKQLIQASGETSFDLNYRIDTRGPVRVVLAVATADGQVSIILDKKIIISELLTITPPSYRGLVPDVRRFKQTYISVLVSPNAERLETMQIHTRILDSKEFPVCPVQTTPVRQRSFRQPLTLPDNLAPGDYKVQSGLTVNGVLSARAETTFTILDSASVPGTVVFDEHNILITDGKPFFPIGIYHVYAPDVPEVAGLGFNVIQVMDWSHNSGDIEALDAAHAHGMKVIMEIGNVFRHPTRIQNVIPMREHPALLAWYGFDEPYAGDYVTARTYTDELTKLDRRHPVWSVSFLGELFSAHVNAFDVFGTDIYSYPKMAPIGDAIRRAVTSTNGERPVWGVVQSFGNETPEGLRCMAYMAVVNGALGLLYYPWDDSSPTGLKYHPEQHTAIRQTCTELRKLEPALVGKHRASFQLADGKVNGLVCSDGGANRYLILVNGLGWESIDNVVIDIPDVTLPLANQLRGVFGEAAPKIQSGKAVVNIAPFEVKVFTW